MNIFLNIIRLKNKHFDFIAKLIALVARSINYLNVSDFFFNLLGIKHIIMNIA